MYKVIAWIISVFSLCHVCMRNSSNTKVINDLQAALVDTSVVAAAAADADAAAAAAADTPFLGGTGGSSTL
jgi:hypothetical protein